MPPTRTWRSPTGPSPSRIPRTSSRGVIDRKTGAARDGFSPRRLRCDVTEKFRLLGRKLPDRAFARLVVDARLLEDLIRNSPHPRSPGEALIEGFIAGARFGRCRPGHPGRPPDPARRPRSLIPASSPNWWAVRPRDRFPGFLDRPGSRHGPGHRDGPGRSRRPLHAAASTRSRLRAAPADQRRDRPPGDSCWGRACEPGSCPGLGPARAGLPGCPCRWEPKSDAARRESPGWPFPSVLAVELAAEARPTSTSGGPPVPSVADALDNALNTFLALVSLDEKVARSGRTDRHP